MGRILLVEVACCFFKMQVMRGVKNEFITVRCYKMISDVFSHARAMKRFCCSCSGA